MKRSNGAAHTAKNETDAINSGRWLLRYKTLNGRNQISKWNVFIAECIISDVQQIIRIVRIVQIVQIVQIVATQPSGSSGPNSSNAPIRSDDWSDLNDPNSRITS